MTTPKLKTLNSKLITALFIIHYSLFIIHYSFAQVIDKKSIAILDDVNNLTKSYKTIKIEFDYKMENKSDNINETKEGVIYIKGDEYNLDISGQNVISDGRTVWTYIKDADEIHINNINPDEDNISFNKLLTNYNKDFRSKLIREDKYNAEDVYIIDLMPLKGKSYHRVRLTISKTKKQILHAAIYEKNGSIYSYVVKKFTTDIPIKDDFFNFHTSDHPKAEIIDMR